MKRILFLILSFVTTILSANNQEVIHNYITANNNFYNIVAKLDEPRKNQFYEELYTAKTYPEVETIATNYFGNGSSEFLSSLNLLAQSIGVLRTSNISAEDFTTYINANWKNEDPNIGGCLNMEGFKKCQNRAYELIDGDFWNRLSEEVANGTGVGGTLGGSIGVFFDGIGAIPGFEIGGILGGIGAAANHAMNWMNARGKAKINCYEVFCLGKDNSLETAGGGGPGGGYKGGHVPFIDFSTH